MYLLSGVLIVIPSECEIYKMGSVITLNGQKPYNFYCSCPKFSTSEFDKLVVTKTDGKLANPGKPFDRALPSESLGAIGIAVNTHISDVRQNILALDGDHLT